MHLTMTDIDSYPATERQKASWREYLNAGKKMVLNIVSSIDIINVNVSSVEKAVQALVARHEGLRTIFVPGEGGLRQAVIPVTNHGVKVQIIDCRSLLGIFKVPSIVGNERLMIFDLENGPLARVLLLLLKNKRAKLIITMQHIICDASSIQVLTDDFLFFYNCFESEKIPQRPSLPYQMRDFALWEQHKLETSEGKRNLEYWAGELGNGLREFQFKKEWLKKEGAANKNGGEFLAYIPQAIVANIKMLAFNSKTTKLSFFCLAFFCLLCYLSGRRRHA